MNLYKTLFKGDLRCINGGKASVKVGEQKRNECCKFIEKYLSLGKER